MNTESDTGTATATEKPKKPKTAKKATEPKAAAPAPSPILNIAPTATPHAVESAYHNHVAKLKAATTAMTALAQRDNAAEIGKLHRANEEPRKALKKQRTKDLQDAQTSYRQALRDAKGAYDALVHKIETENTKAVSDMSHAFNAACEPVNKATIEKLALIEKETTEQLAAATAEYTSELAAAQERARIAAEAEAKAKAEAEAKAKAEAEAKAKAEAEAKAKAEAEAKAKAEAEAKAKAEAKAEAPAA